MSEMIPYQMPFQAMGGGCEVQLFAATQQQAESAASAAIGEVQRIEHKYSRYRDDSIISRINNAAGNGEWIACDQETDWLFDYADALFRSSEGLFDITSGVLRRAWDFKQARIPAQAQLKRLCALIDWPCVLRENGRIQLPVAGMQVDFGGFGKEYAADRAAEVLAEHGIEHGYVNLGGDFAVLGPRPNGAPWMIGIRDPRNARAIIAKLEMYEGGLATSGDYEKFVEIDGEIYCHILNPQTGMPVRHWRSVSVVATSCLVAGSTSSLMMLMQEDAPLLAEQAGFMCLAVDSEGNLHQFNNEAETATSAPAS